MLQCTCFLYNCYPPESMDPPFKLAHGSGTRKYRSDTTHDPANAEQQPNQRNVPTSTQIKLIALSMYCTANTLINHQVAP